MTALPATASEADWETELATDIASFTHDPLGFALYAFPWGEPGTPLEHESLDQWQIDQLRELGERLRKDPHMPQKMLVAAANGVGKTALIGIMFWYLMCTHEDTRGRVTAGTKAQLSQATHAEISKWHNMLICKHWFDVTAEKVCAVEKGKEESWAAHFVPWSKHRPDAFQGLHNKRKRLFFINDEASGIDDVIHDAQQGSLTDEETEIFLLNLTNPMRREGRVYKIASLTGAARAGWMIRHVTGLEAKATNKKQLQAWIDEHGIDSDFVRVRVLGQFPKRSVDSFIDEEEFKRARTREVMTSAGDPLIIGCDVARHGGDETRITFRRGADARSIPSIRLPFDDTDGYLMQLASRLLEEKNSRAADAICIDATGMGWGVADRLKQMKVDNVYAVQFGDPPIGCWSKIIPFEVRDRKTEMYAAAKYWLPNGAVEDSDELQVQACEPKRYYDLNGVTFIESKKDLKARGVQSPDWWESLVTTFAVPIQKVSQAEGTKQLALAHARARAQAGGRQPGDTDPFADVNQSDG